MWGWSVVWVGGGLLLLQAVSLLLIARMLLRLDLQKSQRTPVAADEVPAHLRPVFAATLNQLESLGFRLATWARVESMTRYRTGSGWGAVLQDDEGTVAEVQTNALPEPGRLLSVSFTTCFADGGALQTLNGEAWELLGRPGRTEIHDAFAPRLSDQLVSHRRRRAELAPPRTPVAPSAAEFLRFADRQGREMVRSLDDQRSLVANGDGTYRLTPRAALRWAFRLRRATLLARRRLRRLASGTGEPLPIPVEMEVEAFLRQRELFDKAMSRRSRLWLFVVSLVLFAAVLLPWLSPVTVGLLAFVLLVHELGHLLAMRALGYRDPTVFFLPLLGAAAVGDATNVMAWQRALVSLAGPLPGLLAGGVLLRVLPAAPHPRWVLDLGWLLVVVNALNLLPMQPLDGGQLLNELVFSRRAWTALAFRVFSSAALLAGGALVPEPILLVLGALGLVSLPITWRRARLVQAIRRLELPSPVAGREGLAACFGWLRTNAPRVSFHERAALVQSVRRAGQLAAAPVATTLVTLAVWLSCLAAVPAVVWLRRDTEVRAAIARAHADLPPSDRPSSASPGTRPPEP
jgi:Zn-dependent protease